MRIENFASQSGKINERDRIAKTMMHENEPLGRARCGKTDHGWLRAGKTHPPALPPFFVLCVSTDARSEKAKWSDAPVVMVLFRCATMERERERAQELALD